MTNHKKYDILCAICKKATKIVGKHIRMTCMCDDEYRIIHLDDINNPEHTWRFYLLDGRTNQYANANDQRLDRCTV